MSVYLYTDDHKFYYSYTFRMKFSIIQGYLYLYVFYIQEESIFSIVFQVFTYAVWTIILLIRNLLGGKFMC